MSTKPQSPGPNPTSTASTKQVRSRKAANPDSTTGGRAGSAGGVVLEKEPTKKPPTPATSTASKAAPAQPNDGPPKRKPRKLNKEPTSTSAEGVKSLSNEAAELEALKSRVKGLEAKVEELYKSTSATAPRSPRRRGKGRKTSSATTTATLGNLAQSKDKGEELEDEEADEELNRLESELETARQDLALYQPSYGSRTRPGAKRTASEDTELVEEIPRDAPGVSVGSDRQVTLSGSYRIPLPASLNPEDVKTIQSGVSAAQNVARSFLDQRRANQAMKQAQTDAGPPPTTRSSKAKASSKAASAQSTEMSATADTGGKQSWGEWIGGYSMAISRAVKSIEHEAAMEAQTQRPVQTRVSGTPRSTAGGGAKKKRPNAKTTLSGEQVQGLMS